MAIRSASYLGPCLEGEGVRRVACYYGCFALAQPLAPLHGDREDIARAGDRAVAIRESLREQVLPGFHVAVDERRARNDSPGRPDGDVVVAGECLIAVAAHAVRNVGGQHARLRTQRGVEIVAQTRG